jgi:hypothetical protein
LRQIVFAMMLISTAAPAQQPPLQKAPTIPLDSIADFLKLPSNVHLGETAGVEVSLKRHVSAFSRDATRGPALCRRAPQLAGTEADLASVSAITNANARRRVFSPTC